MTKDRQEISAYTFRKDTQHIRQLLLHPFWHPSRLIFSPNSHTSEPARSLRPLNENMSLYQENMWVCQRVLAAGFVT